MTIRERLSNWLNPKKEVKHSTAEYIDGYYPWYSQFGDNIYASDVVQQVLMSIVNELIKLDMVHIRTNNKGEEIRVNAYNIQNVLDNPNPLMTGVDYKSKMFWNLLLNDNAFAYPIWEGNNLKAIYPLQPTYVEWQQDSTGNYYIQFKFASDYCVTLPYADVIHIRHKYSVSEFMGGGKDGQSDNRPLLETLKINDTLIKGLAKSLKMQSNINGVIKMRTMVNDESQRAEINKFEAKLQNNDSGILPIDIQSDFIPLNKQIALLDKTTLEYQDKKVARWFGGSVPVIDRDYTPEQYEAFYQSTLEPIIKAASEAHTKALFSRKATFGYGNKISFYTKELIFMNNNQKLSLANLLVDSGACYKNELRTMFGLRPLTELEGQIAESSNKTNAENNKPGESQDENLEEKEDEENGK